jgi:hypothetical protein
MAYASACLPNDGSTAVDRMRLPIHCSACLVRCPALSCSLGKGALGGCHGAMSWHPTMFEPRRIVSVCARLVWPQ